MIKNGTSFGLKVVAGPNALALLERAIKLFALSSTELKQKDVDELAKDFELWKKRI